MFFQHNSFRLLLSLFVSLSACLLLLPSAQADGYVGFEIVPMSVTISNDTPNQIVNGTSTSLLLMTDEEEFAPVTVRARIGLTILPDLYPALSLESHFGFDVADDTKDVVYTEQVNAGPVDTKVKSQTIQLDIYVGFYARADFSLGDKASAYVNMGYASAQFDGNFGNYGLPNDNTVSSPSYGIGATYVLPWYGLTAYFDYTQLVDTDFFKVSGFGLGISAELD